jgi:multiple sugar transport system permease protein
MITRRMLRRSAVSWLVLPPLLVLALLPFAVMLSTALKPLSEVTAFPPRWLPSRLDWQNFVDTWATVDFGTGVANSLFVSLTATLLTVLVSVPAGYAMSRLPFRGTGLYRQFLLVTKMLSPILLVLGLFRMAASIHIGDATLVDTRIIVVVIYAAFNIAFAVWMLAAYFGTIPIELEEAAWIDGANRLQSVLRIFLPLSLPAIAVTGIVTFVSSWNEFVVALTMLRDPSRLTLPLNPATPAMGRRLPWAIPTKERRLVAVAYLKADVPVSVKQRSLGR